MAELTTQERLQPSLLDRLTDDNPGSLVESREERVISASRLRECVTRDLGWLLNCANLESTEDLSLLPEVRRSVLNFGIPDITGIEVAQIEASALQRQVRDMILAFDPRLKAATLRVVAETNRENMSGHALSFRIESEMWAQPIPLNLYLKTEVDLETGKFKISESGS